MADFSKRFNSNKQKWETPISLFSKLNQEFKFDFDLAASEEDAKCPQFFSEQDDALKQTWKGVCWLNPPYGSKEYKLENWIKKAFDESKTTDCVVVMLIPVRSNTKWWHNYCMKAAEVRFICGRPKFGDAPHGLPLPLAIVIFKNTTKDTIFSSQYL